jgi:hypothetical protein
MLISGMPVPLFMASFPALLAMCECRHKEFQDPRIEYSVPGIHVLKGRAWLGGGIS